MEMQNPVEITCERDRVDIDYCYGFIGAAYWAMNRSRGEFENAVAKSLCASAFCDGRQVGFARAVTDNIAVAYVADVFVDENYRRRGIALQLVSALHDHPEMNRVRRWLLATRDMQPIYRKLGYVELDDMMMMRIAEDAVNHPPLR
ncbi:GNAT family N-acetyltransferase [Thalassospira marina]|uniref:GNAT family N-acetyltransferase n=1 Tax=Thalassospira marina TaxID=2048283 RepID=A0ABM6QE69_9PROT|nr:GNAT family N-acetyltransferase [Thalassospira marina]AUG54849.1 GNAT family N-acetyltransferase [Thalassospira marina]